MTRREFLHRLTSLFGLLALPALPALPASAKASTASPHIIQQCHLAGFQHHDGEELWPYLTVGDSLQLVREPGNPHDAHAIRIDWLGRKLGYLPRSQNQTAARLIDQGKRLEARIGALEKHANPWRRVAVEVWLVG